ncbi:MAG: UDP-2,3-diacylglucosamine diphosphatase [Bacteroidales bacterium]|nr:UDP-2,3-diacylglucosamine diphosphatase [Bacteroidales bacterium]
MPNSKLYFITDAHLGAGPDSPQRERDLCSLLDQMKLDAAMVVFLGDMFDFWFTYRYVVPRGHVRLLGKMAELADAGIELHFFIGNHDMWLFDYLQKEVGAIMHDEPDTLIFDGRRFLVGHGDGLGHLDRRYDIIRRIFRNRLNQRLFALLPSGLTFGIANSWSNSSRKSHIKKNPNLFDYFGDDREGIVIYCRQRLQHEHFDYCVFGHRHTPLVKDDCLPNCTYVNVGDWLMHRNYAVYEDGRLQLIDLKQ